MNDLDRGISMKRLSRGAVASLVALAALLAVFPAAGQSGGTKQTMTRSEAEKITVYVSRDLTYHRKECSWRLSLDTAPLSLTEAHRDGYSPCPHCQPPLYPRPYAGSTITITDQDLGASGQLKKMSDPAVWSAEERKKFGGDAFWRDRAGQEVMLLLLQTHGRRSPKTADFMDWAASMQAVSSKADLSPANCYVELSQRRSKDLGKWIKPVTLGIRVYYGRLGQLQKSLKPEEVFTLLLNGQEVFIPPIGGPTSLELSVALGGGVSLDLALIPAGAFLMGSGEQNGATEDEKPRHKVAIRAPFYLGVHEVTQGQWLAVMKSWDKGIKPNASLGLGADCPVYNVSWNDCQRFIAELTKLLAHSGKVPGEFRLPSEAEWEYACRAGMETSFYFGETPAPAGREDLAWADAIPAAGGGNADRKASFLDLFSPYIWASENSETAGCKPVAQKKPNAFGLYDMSGNVAEWCQDAWHAHYIGAPADGSAWDAPVTAANRVVRGGAWSEEAMKCRSASRNLAAPDARFASIGFRLAMTR